MPGKREFMLRDCIDLDALEQNAQRVMRPESWVFCDTGADDQITSKENVTAPQWFHLYMQPDREAPGALLDRCVRGGFKARVLTVDQPVPGWSPRAARTPVIPSPNVRSVNMIGQPIAKTAYDPDRKGLAMFPTNFTDLEWLVQRCAMPVVVKGVLRGDDAKRCVGCGVQGIMVSNHSGRHLDTTVTTAEVIAEIVEAVGTTAEVYVDGGIRRGTDIVKALALGARAVLLGRPPLWRLSADVADGVRMGMERVLCESVRAMQL